MKWFFIKIKNIHNGGYEYEQTYTERYGMVRRHDTTW
jgi:hypothetical protein